MPRIVKKAPKPFYQALSTANQRAATLVQSAVAPSTRSQPFPKPFRSLSQVYGDQLRAIGDILVRAGILTKKEIANKGIRFAVRDHFEPLPLHKRSKASANKRR